MEDGRSLDQLPLRELTDRAREHVGKLVRQEIALVKAEMSDDVKRAGKGGALIGAGLYFLAAGMLLLLAAAAYAISQAEGNTHYLGYIVLGLFLGALALGAAVGGAMMLMKARGGLKLTRRSLKTDLTWLRHPTHAPNPELEELRASHLQK